MSVDDLDQTPTVMLVRRTLELARSEPVLQSDEYWAQVRALHFRAGRDVFEDQLGSRMSTLKFAERRWPAWRNDWTDGRRDQGHSRTR
jgi:hypothetical protein